jgi:hypothetical protein
MRQVSIGISGLSIETMLFLRDSYKASPIKLAPSSGIHMLRAYSRLKAFAQISAELRLGFLTPAQRPNLRANIGDVLS